MTANVIDTLDQLVDMHSKLVTAMYRRAQHGLDEAVKRHRPTLRDALQSFHTTARRSSMNRCPRKAEGKP
jgi:hypothetical protein